MKKLLAAAAIACVGLAGCGGSETTDQHVLGELKYSEALMKHPREVGMIPAHYVAEIEEVCNRYEEPLYRLEQAALAKQRYPRTALNSGERLRSVLLARVKRIALKAGPQGKSYLESLVTLFEKETAADQAFAAGPGPTERLQRIEGDGAEEAEARSEYRLMREEVGIVRCRV
jgi:hypothetical protein